jgi:predicted RND superfamily exporter protein
MGYFVVKNIYFDSSFYAFLDENSPAIRASKAIAEQFGDSSPMMILMPFDMENANKSLKEIKNVVEAIKTLSFVKSVDSVFDAQKNGGLLLTPPFIRFEPYVEVIPSVNDPKEYTMRLNPDILSDDAYSGVLISEDGKYVVITLRKHANVKAQAIEMVNTVRRTIESATKQTYHLIGEDVVDSEIFNSVRMLMFVYPPLILLVVLGIFYIKFRSIYLSILTLIPPVIASVWVYFLLLVFHKNINSLTVMLPTFIIIIGSAYGMHYLSRFRELRSSDSATIFPEDTTTLSQRKSALRVLAKRTFLEERMPIFFSALTTAAGFASNIFLNMEAFRDMGIFTSIGIFLCALFTLQMIPDFLMFYKKAFKPSKREPEKTVKTVERANSVFGYRILKYLFLVFVFAGVIASPFLIPKVSLELDSYKYFKPHSEINQSAEQLKSQFGWVSNFYLVFETKDANPLDIQNEEAEFLAAMVSDLETIPHIAKSMSIFTIGKSLKVSLPLLLKLSNISSQGKEMTASFLTKNSFRVMLFLDSNDSGAAKTVKERIEERLKETLLRDKYTISLAGAPLIWSELSASVVNSQVQSILISFVLILLLLFISFRNIKAALLSSIPILITIIFNFIYMSVFRISLDIPTAIVSGMLQGLVIDYAIHFMYWYGKTGDLKSSYRLTASPIIFNGLSLMGCFAVLLTAPLSIYVKLALLMVLGIGTGVLATLVVLPALINIKDYHPIRNRFLGRKYAQNRDSRDRSVD